jgi:crossover junction endodeoxyribonuclease RusA
MGDLLNLVQGNPPDRVVRFTVPGEPRSKQRPRVTNHGTFTPKETMEAERKFKEYWRALGEEPFKFHVLVEIEFYNGNKRRRDLDNMAKLVLDALNGEAYDDDFRVVEMNLTKRFTSKDKARTVVVLREIIEWPDEADNIQPLLV